MKVSVVLDDEKYIISISSNDEGEYEIDDDFDFEYLRCYHLVDDKIVLDEDKKAEQINEEKNAEEIAELQNDLNSTDYIMARCFEEIMALNKPLTFIADMIAILVKYSKQYKDVIQQRKTWRERIEELKKQSIIKAKEKTNGTF